MSDTSFPERVWTRSDNPITRYNEQADAFEFVAHRYVSRLCTREDRERRKEIVTKLDEAGERLASVAA